MTRPATIAPLTGGPITRFVRAGIRDATDRLARWIDRPRPDDTRVAALIESSRVVRTVSAVFLSVCAAARTSAALAAARRGLGRWTGLGVAGQRRALGAMLVTAAGTHVAMRLTQPLPPGWLWLILPGLAVTVGGLLLLASTAGDSGAQA